MLFGQGNCLKKTKYVYVKKKKYSNDKVMGIMTYSSDITKIRTYKSKNNRTEVYFAAILTD